MAYLDDLTHAEERYQAELASGSFTNAEAALRRLRRRLFAQRNTAGTADEGVIAALAAMHVFDGIHIDDTSFTTTKVAYEAALATLVADGATPTQAHVTAANSAYASYLAHILPRKFVAADKATHESALATLVADGATPTQAHVTAANNAYTTFVGNLK